MGSSAQVLGLDAVVLIVKDLAAQQRFYHEVLGLPIVGEYGDAVFFACGAQKLALFARSHHPQGTARLDGAAKGVSHLEFGVTAAGEEEFRRRLTAAGYHAYGENYCDADGNLFHFNRVDAAEAGQ
jgi:catechol 2,3-dioxygenase-like lactoylglutathione lyase family enzyme